MGFAVGADVPEGAVAPSESGLPPWIPSRGILSAVATDASVPIRMPVEGFENSRLSTLREMSILPARPRILSYWAFSAERS